MAPPAQGRIVDEHGNPLAGLLIVAPGPLAPTHVATTDEDGAFPIPAGAPVDLAVTDALGCRTLRRLPDDLSRPVPIPRRLAHGWLVTDETGEPTEWCEGNEVEVFIDSDLFAEIAKTVARARSYVNLSQLLFFPEFMPTGDGHSRLVEAFLAANRRGCAVRILVNENLVVPDTYDELLEHFQAEGDNGVEVRRLTMSPNVLHAKVLIVDGVEAFVIGPPFEQKYWDTPRHALTEARRGAASPLHDMSLRVRGPAVAALDRFFVEFWNLSGAGSPPIEPCASPPRAADQHLQLAHTIPPALLPHAPGGERTILEGLQRALASAERFIYIENQYFTNGSLAACIRAALDRNPRLEAILVLNEWTDIPTYISWQARRLAEMGWPDHPRLGVFSLWSPAPRPKEMRPIYVHSKLAMADDAWATLGTANFDSMSLEESTEFGLAIDQNVELNVNLLDGIEGARRTGLVGRLRRRLWAEHLGDEGVWTTREPDEGWLPHWRRIAEQNLERVDRGDLRLQGTVLPHLPGPIKKLAPTGRGR